jgi:hypothetical protein
MLRVINSMVYQLANNNNPNQSKFNFRKRAGLSIDGNYFVLNLNDALENESKIDKSNVLNK